MSRAKTTERARKVSDLGRYRQIDELLNKGKKKPRQRSRAKLPEEDKSE